MSPTTKTQNVFLLIINDIQYYNGFRVFKCFKCFKVVFKCLLFIYLLIFGYTGSSLLHRLFSRLGEQGLLSSCGARASHCDGFSGGAQALGFSAFSSCSSWAPEYRLSSCGALGLVALRQEGSSWIRDWTCVSCIGRQILNHWATREDYNVLLNILKL